MAPSFRKSQIVLAPFGAMLAVSALSYVALTTQALLLLGSFGASTLLLFHLYEVGFRYWDSGYAAALTMVLLVLLASVALFQFFVLDKRVHYK